MTASHLECKKRILIFRIGELGDTLIALPALRAIRNSFPDAHIAWLGNIDSEGRHITPRQVLPVNGLINEWILYAVGSRSRFSDPIRLLWQLRRARYDLLVYLVPRVRSTSDVRRDLLFFRLSGIREVIGHRGILPLPPPSTEGLPTVEHEADHLLHRISLSKISVPSPGAADFDLELTDAELGTSAAWLSKHVPSFAIDNLVAFGPGSKWLSKIWPEERFVEVGCRLIDEANVFPLVFGGSEDRQLGDRLVRAWGRGGNAAGREAGHRLCVVGRQHWIGRERRASTSGRHG